MYESVTVNIMVENVCETINFYQRLLGFEKIITVPDEGKELEFALLKKDSMQIMFQSKESITQEYPSLETNEIKPMFTLYIMVTEIEKLYNELKETVSIVKKLHTTMYGKVEFAIYDNNSNILTFAS